MLKDNQDAFGRMMNDYYTGNHRVTPVIERDDGYLDVDRPDLYFSAFEEWQDIERQAMQYVKGRVLDIGCGAGRHSLYLQKQGHEVVGIDNSPLAIEVSRRRGLKDARICSITQINKSLGKFDTVIMLGNNFSLVGTPESAKRILKRLAIVTSNNGRIIAQTIDPYSTDNPDHLAYHNANRVKDRLGGQASIKYRYKKYATSWIGFLMVSKPEMEELLEGTNWIVEKYLDEKTGKYRGIYVAILKRVLREKTDRTFW